MSDESDRATAEQLVAEGITWEEVWAAAQRLALERGEWAGYPVPVQEAALVIEPRHPAHDQFHGVSITKLERDKHTDVYIVTAYATDGKGRTDAATGAVFTGQLKGDMLANALMKAETKAKRRVTLSLCGLGLLDETEVETIAGTIPGEPKNERETIVLGDPSRPMTEPDIPLPGQSPVTEQQIKRFYAIARGSGWTEDQIHDLLASHKLNKAAEITMAAYDGLVETLKKGPGKK